MSTILRIDCDQCGATLFEESLAWITRIPEKELKTAMVKIRKDVGAAHNRHMREYGCPNR